MIFVKNLSRYLKFRLRYSFIFYITQLAFRKKDWIFSRTACLGNDTYFRLMEEASRETLRLNLQKNRIDSFNSSLRTKRIGLTGFRVLDRRDIIEIIWIQSLRFWRHLPPPKYVLMDSYSELTDQLFFLGNRSFFANYTDVKKKYLQKKKVVSEGLLETKEFSSQYRIFFEEVYRIWKEKNQLNIYFIHFPHKFESRELFIVRAQEIRNTIDELTLTYPNLISIVIPEDLVKKQMNEFGALDAFPYHFDENAAKYVAQEIDRHEAALNGKI
jgi:hypothetical protein